MTPQGPISPEASIIIPTYNRRDALEMCLFALCCQAFPRERYEIIVVDDGSTDSTGEMVAHIRGLKSSPAISYVYAPHRGPGAARNTGLKIARGHLIIFIDSDIVVAQDFVRSHIEAHTAPGLIVHGPVINTAWAGPLRGSVHITDSPYITDSVHITDMAAPRRIKYNIGDTSTSFFATGNVSIARHWLFDAGLFDEDFTEYGWEDLELGRRLRRLGLRVVRSPRPVGFHLRPFGGSRSLAQIMQKERERGHMAVLYYRKHPELRVKMSTMIFRPFFWIADLLSLGGWPERPGVIGTIEVLSGSRLRPLVGPIVQVMRYRAYVKGVREGLH